MNKKDVFELLKKLVEESRQYEEKVKVINKNIKNNEELIENIILDIEGENIGEVREEIKSCRDLYDSIHKYEIEKKGYQQEIKKRRKTVEEIIMEEGEFDKDQLTFGDVVEDF